MECLAALGLPPTATWRQVKRSYRRLALENHPDRAGATPTGRSGHALRRFYDVTDAYASLQDFYRADRLGNRIEACAYCAQLRVTHVGLDGNRYCRECLVHGRTRRGLPAPSVIVVRFLATAAALIVSALCLAAWTHTGTVAWWWLSVVICVAAFLALAGTCVRVQYAINTDPRRMPAERKRRRPRRGRDPLG